MDQNVRNKLNEIRQKQLESEKRSRAHEPSGAAGDKSLKLAAIGGVAAGLIIAWLIHLALPTTGTDPLAQTTRLAIYESDIREANRSIEQLNDRLELLADSIARLESGVADTIESTARQQDDGETGTTIQASPGHAERDPEPALPAMQDAATDADAAVKATAFIPTHVVETRLNLRPSRSLGDAPIGVLDTGTEVVYLDERDGWYYVDTRELGKGWCASEFLSPL